MGLNFNDNESRERERDRVGAVANRGKSWPYKFLIKSIIRTNKPQKIRLRNWKPRAATCAPFCACGNWNLTLDNGKCAGQGKFRRENLPAQLPNPQSGRRLRFSIARAVLQPPPPPQPPHRFPFFFLINGKLVFLGSKAANPFGNPLPAPFTRFIWSFCCFWRNFFTFRKLIWLAWQAKGSRGRQQWQAAVAGSVITYTFCENYMQFNF